MNSTVDDIDITDEQVARYLKNHPGFFLSREDLIMDLKLVHPSGKAVSLLERQVALLRERNMDMRQRLSELLDNARDNDTLFGQSRRLTLALLEARTLDQLTSAFNHAMTHDFDVDFATVVLISELPPKSSGSRVVTTLEAQRQIANLLKNRSGTLGILRAEEVEFLFPKQHSQIGSCAVMPIGSQPSQGVIAIGSKNPDYFHSGMGTLFLGYLAELMERLAPRFLKQ